jgi:signal transduction histidine kinase
LGNGKFPAKRINWESTERTLMDHKILPASRLTIIFILAVILSGSVLTYFSINNISNLKELTEKKILEEQRELSSRLLSTIENKIEKVTLGFENEIIQPGLIIDSLIKRVADYDFIIQPFILKNNGQFLFPNFVGIPENPSGEKFSNRFKSAYITGEEAEFAERKPGKAKNYYLSCLGYSIGGKDSVKSLNALGRISVKLNNIIDALTYYNLIISDYSMVTDENGLPYSYYALPQLLKITNANNLETILTSVEFCLEKMNTGSVPLNYNTEELVSLVEDWLKNATFNNSERLANIDKLIESIKKQVQLTIIYGNELSGILVKGISDNNYTAGNNFKLVNSISGTSQEFFLINTNFKSPAGFLIDRKVLFDAILKTDLQSDYDFDYKIAFPTVNNSNTTGDNLVYTSQLNPVFPEQLMEIKLTDETLIKDIIKRRSLIYGIASLLLLVAMLLGVVLILRDIRRENHVARLRSDFISNVTHELKTPLTSIRMYAESLLMGRVKSDQVQKEYLSVVVNESERLKRMINNILEFSKMEKGKPEYFFVNSNLASILKSAIQEMKYWLDKEGFDVVTELDDIIFARVDPEKMKQAISNLFSNAIKYSTDTKKIYVRLYQKSDHIFIEVEDCGIGIAEDKLSRIFEEFYRIEQKEIISGTGLGLTVVKEIIEAHNGTISVTSEIGKGSRFTIRIPLEGI